MRAGSACGKALGALPSTTVGYERRNAWWGRYLEAGDEQGFIDELLDGQPDAHAYFGRMKRQNRDGPRVLGPRGELPELASAEVARMLADDTAVLVDTRAPDEVRTGTVRGALAVPAGDKAASYGAWAYDPETESRPLVLFVPDRETGEDVRDHLVRVGIDEIAGFTTAIDGLPVETPAQVDPADLESTDAALVLDVRSRSEHAAGHVPGSQQLSAGRLLWNLGELPEDGLIVTYCQSGARNAVAASVLRRAGFDVAELAGSYAGWSLRHDGDRLQAAH